MHGAGSLSVGNGWTQLMSTIRVEGNAATLDIPPAWLQGRTAFGGLQAALALRAMRSQLPPVLGAVPLRTLQATFLAPVPAGKAVAKAQLLRAGKNSCHVEARLMDGDNVAALLIGVFGPPRLSKVRHLPLQGSFRPNPQPIPFRFLPNLTPSFTQYFEASWVAGQPPYTGDKAPHHVVELAMKDNGPCSESHVLALADFIPPVALSHLRLPAPGATLTWMLEMQSDQFSLQPLMGWRVDATMLAARDGYTSQSVTLWQPDSTPACLSRQSMVVFG